MSWKVCKTGVLGAKHRPFPDCAEFQHPSSNTLEPKGLTKNHVPTGIWGKISLEYHSFHHLRTDTISYRHCTHNVRLILVPGVIWRRFLRIVETTIWRKISKRRSVVQFWYMQCSILYQRRSEDTRINEDSFCTPCEFIEQENYFGLLHTHTLTCNPKLLQISSSSRIFKKNISLTGVRADAKVSGRPPRSPASLILH